MRRIYEAGLGRWLAVGVALLAQPVVAQPNPAATIAPAAPSRNPSDRLAANLVILSQNPRDVGALTEAGLSAIAVGDGDAALSFLSRAEEILPANGRIKAAIGSALLLKEKPTDALKLFGEAVNLGVAEQVVARDRGLAYDLRGDSKRAQRDYSLALHNGADDELTIRYALSLGISGDDQKAFELLDPLLRQRNPMAWLARAFVLAMNGDMRGAEVVANTVMPGGPGGSMSPFLRRLATLNAAERALAVNFGIMPSDGQRYAMVETGDPYRPAGVGTASDTLIPAGDPFGPRPEDTADRSRRADPVSKEPRRRPGGEKATLTVASATPGPANQRVGKRIGPVDPERLPPEVREALKPGSTGPKFVASSATSLPPPSGAVVALAPTPATVSNEPPAPRFEIPETVVRPAVRTGNPTPIDTAFATPITNQLPKIDQPEPKPQQIVVIPPRAQFVPQPVTVVPSVGGLDSILASLQTEEESAAGPLPTAAELKAARIATQRKAAADIKAEAEAKKAKDAKEALRQAAAKNPARIWVQVATGSNEAGLPGTWKKLKEKAPAAFKGQSASSVAFKATNRLLVGPFKSAAEARALVNAMSKAGLQGNTFNSEAGQAIAKVSAR